MERDLSSYSPSYSHQDKEFGEDIQCLCFTVLHENGTDTCLPVSLILLVSPRSDAVDKPNKVVNKLLGKYKLHCNARDCCFYPNYCYYYQNFVEIEPNGSKERYLFLLLLQKVQINHHLSHLCPDLMLN